MKIFDVIKGKYIVSRRQSVPGKIIKRCPHCNTYFGGIEIWKSATARWFEPKWNLYCANCHWCGGKAYTRRGAIRVWNDDIERMRQNGEVSG